MISQFDKALIAAAMGVILLVNTFTSFHIGLTEEKVTAAVGVIGPILVYLVPNKQP